MAENKLSVIQATQSIEELDKLVAKSKELVVEFKILTESADKINALFKSGVPKSYIEGTKEMTVQLEKYSQSLKTIEKLERDVLSLRDKLDKQDKSRNSTKTEEQRLLEKNAKLKSDDAKAIALLKEENRLLTQEKKSQALADAKLANNIKDNIGHYKRFNIEVANAKLQSKNLGAQIIELEKRFKNGEISSKSYNLQIKQLSKEYTEAKLKASGLDIKLKELNASVGDRQGNVGNYASAIGKLSTSFMGLLSAFGAVSAIGMFSELIKSSYESIKILNAQNNALKVVFETETQVARQKEYISEVSDKYGLSLIKTIEDYTKFSAAVRGSYLEGEKARDIFSSFSGASAKLGLSAEQNTGIFKALEQMISKGKIQAEELRGQLGDRMAGSFKLFADGMGLTTSELDNLLKKGGVIADDVLPKVADKLKEVYDLNTAEKINTIASAQARFSNIWTEFLDDMSQDKSFVDGMVSTIDNLSIALEYLLDILIVKGNDGTSVMHDTIEVINILTESIGNILESLGLLDKQQKNNLLSVNAFKNDLSALKLVIANVTAQIVFMVDIISALAESIASLNFDTFLDKWSASTAKAMSVFENTSKKLDEIEKANKRGDAYVEPVNHYVEAWKKAKDAKLSYFQLDGKYFDAKTGKNTGKSLDDYIDVDGTLQLKKKVQATKVSNELIKSNNKTERSILKDHLRDLEAIRAERLAINEFNRIREFINEEEYLKKQYEINNNFYIARLALLKGKTAEERKLIGESKLAQVKNEKKFNEDMFKLLSERLDKEYNKITKHNDRVRNIAKDNEYITETERNKRLLDDVDERIKAEEKYYDNKIANAIRTNQVLTTIADIEFARDNALLDLEDERFKIQKDFIKSTETDLERSLKLLNNSRLMNDEDRKSAIIKSDILSYKEKELALERLSLELSLEDKKNNRDNLKAERLRLDNLVVKTTEQQMRLSEVNLELKKINAEIEQGEKGLRNWDVTSVVKGLKPAVDTLTKSFNDMGLNLIADEFSSIYDRILTEGDDFKLSAQDIFKGAMMVVFDFANQLTEQSKQRRISALDEQLKYSQATTEQEIGFLQSRIDGINNIQEKTQEQIEERNAMEDEARVLKEQQAQREKQIAIQKAKAEQQASAQQALISGGVAAVQTLANPGGWLVNLPFALAALAFGGAQAGLIMSRNPVPQYFVGTSDAMEGWAKTQEQGRELITDRYGNVKSYGSDDGTHMTYLNKGDKVYTANQTKDILSGLNSEPNYQDMIFKNNVSPTFIQNQIDEERLIRGIGQEYEKVAKKYDKPSNFIKDGEMYFQKSNNIPIKMDDGQSKVVVIKQTKVQRD